MPAIDGIIGTAIHVMNPSKQKTHSDTPLIESKCVFSLIILFLKSLSHAV